MEIILNELKKEVRVNVKPVAKNRWDLLVGIIGTAELHAMSGLGIQHNRFSFSFWDSYSHNDIDSTSFLIWV